MLIVKKSKVQKGESFLWHLIKNGTISEKEIIKIDQHFLHSTRFEKQIDSLYEKMIKNGISVSTGLPIATFLDRMFSFKQFDQDYESIAKERHKPIETEF